MKTAAILALVGAASAVDTVSYSDIFINGQSYAPGSSQVDNWNAFPGLIDTNPGAYTSVAFGSTSTSFGLSCVTQALVDSIAAAFAATTDGFSTACGINTWQINDCGADGFEIHANGPTCGCTNPGDAAARIRPQDTSGNWGGVFESNPCPGATQALSLTFTAPQIVADPVFTGFDNSEYEFKGVAYEVFNIITDVDFQLNARFVPWNHGTFMGDLGFLLGDHTIEIHANGTVLADGIDMKVDQEYAFESATATFSGVTLTVEHTSFSVNARIMAENRIDFNVAANTPIQPHGILGQTYGRDNTEQKSGAAGELETAKIAGTYTSYLVEDGLLGTKFPYNRFGSDNRSARAAPMVDAVLAWGRGMKA